MIGPFIIIVFIRHYFSWWNIFNCYFWNVLWYFLFNFYLRVMINLFFLGLLPIIKRLFINIFGRIVKIFFNLLWAIDIELQVWLHLLSFLPLRFLLFLWLLLSLTLLIRKQSTLSLKFNFILQTFFQWSILILNPFDLSL